MKTKSWRWMRAGDSYGRGWVLQDGRGRTRANVWGNGIWHTWDEEGIGGENGVCEGPRKIQDAMDQVMAAVVRQDWVPWKVEYAKPE